MRALFMALDVDNLWERKKNKNAGTTISVYIVIPFETGIFRKFSIEGIPIPNPNQFPKNSEIKMVNCKAPNEPILTLPLTVYS